MAHDDEGGDNQILAKFPRRNSATKAGEQVRIVVSEFNGRIVTHFRVYFLAKPEPETDLWRPSKVGVTVREEELDEAIEALQEARRQVHAAGRSTASAPVQSRPQTTTRASSRKPVHATSSAPRETQLDAFDDLAEFRRRRP
jgi:hypothetical protein